MNLREFGSWGLEKGTVANPEPDFGFEGECVSLIQQYLFLVLGIKFKARGNAKDWATNTSLLEDFERLNPNVPLQKGDILVYGANYGGGYGHVALIDINNKFYDQNGVKRRAIGYQDKPYNGYICILRPKNQKNIIEETKPQSQKLILPAHIQKWRIYPLDKAPVVGNEKGFLLPAKFGGLEYDIIRYTQSNVAVIGTRDYGEVQIYVGKDTDAIIK